MPATLGDDEGAVRAGMSFGTRQKPVPALQPRMRSTKIADNTTLTAIEPRQPRRQVKRKNSSSAFPLSPWPDFTFGFAFLRRSG